MKATFPYRLAAVDLDDTLPGPGKRIGAARMAVNLVGPKSADPGADVQAA